MKNLKIIFMGTTDFAVKSLDILVKNNFTISAVITTLDKPKGRGRKLMTSAVKDYALEKGLNILQPSNLKSPLFFEQLKKLNADLQIVVAFRMLPKSIWSMPPMGTFNLHASLLPQYRGAAPIHWAIINGEKETGITTFFLNHEIDTGNILLQEKENIFSTDTTGSLYNRLMHKGAELVMSTVQLIQKGNVKFVPQKEDYSLKKAPKLFKETCKIDWDQPAEQVYNFIRGLNPYPVAWTILNGHKVKLFKAEVDSSNLEAGTTEMSTKNKMKVGCKKGSLLIKELQLEGKKKMSIEDFLRGNKLF